VAAGRGVRRGTVGGGEADGKNKIKDEKRVIDIVLRTSIRPGDDDVMATTAASVGGCTHQLIDCFSILGPAIFQHRCVLFISCTPFADAAYIMIYTYIYIYKYKMFYIHYDKSI